MVFIHSAVGYNIVSYKRTCNHSILDQIEIEVLSDNVVDHSVSFSALFPIFLK